MSLSDLDTLFGTAENVLLQILTLQIMLNVFLKEDIVILVYLFFYLQKNKHKIKI